MEAGSYSQRTRTALADARTSLDSVTFEKTGTVTATLIASGLGAASYAGDSAHIGMPDNTFIGQYTVQLEPGYHEDIHFTPHDPSGALVVGFSLAAACLMAREVGSSVTRWISSVYLEDPRQP